MGHNASSFPDTLRFVSSEGVSGSSDLDGEDGPPRSKGSSPRSSGESISGGVRNPSRPARIRTRPPQCSRAAVRRR